MFCFLDWCFVGLELNREYQTLGETGQKQCGADVNRSDSTGEGPASAASVTCGTASCVHSVTV